MCIYGKLNCQGFSQKIPELHAIRRGISAPQQTFGARNNAFIPVSVAARLLGFALALKSCLPFCFSFPLVCRCRQRRQVDKVKAVSAQHHAGKEAAGLLLPPSSAAAKQPHHKQSRQRRQINRQAAATEHKKNGEPP